MVFCRIRRAGELIAARLNCERVLAWVLRINHRENRDGKKPMIITKSVFTSTPSFDLFCALIVPGIASSRLRMQPVGNSAWKKANTRISVNCHFYQHNRCNPNRAFCLNVATLRFVYESLFELTQVLLR